MPCSNASHSGTIVVAGAAQAMRSGRGGGGLVAAAGTGAAALAWPPAVGAAGALAGPAPAAHAIVSAKPSSVTSRGPVPRRELPGERAMRIMGASFRRVHARRERSSGLAGSRLERCLRSLQPERHLHAAVHVDRGRQLALSLLATTSALVELAQPEVAVGRQRAHLELVGQGQRLAVVGFGLLHFGWISPGGDLAKEAERPRFVAALIVLAGLREGAPGN